MRSARAYTDLIDALGIEHPLTRAERAVGLATTLAAGASALLLVAVSLALVNPGLAIGAGWSMAVVAPTCWGIVVVLAGHRRRCVHQVILEGADPASQVVRSERRRLTDPDRCARVAAVLDTALHESAHWNAYPPASRPPFGALPLASNAPVVEQITTCLRNAVPSPRAMVLLDRFVRGGYGADIYQAGPEWVRRELGRIRFELLTAAAVDRPEDRPGRTGVTGGDPV